MNLQSFVQKVESEFEDMESGLLTAETRFKDLEEWSSMYALLLIAMIDVEYEVTISGEDLGEAQTIEDIFNFIQQRKTI